MARRPEIGALPKAAGWLVSDTRVERIRRREGSEAPAKLPVAERPAAH